MKIEIKKDGAYIKAKMLNPSEIEKKLMEFAELEERCIKQAKEKKRKEKKRKEKKRRKL